MNVEEGAEVVIVVAEKFEKFRNRSMRMVTTLLNV